jgi:uncharacterized protein DUF6328
MPDADYRGPEDAKKGDLNDLLQELRILLQGAQVLTAFLTVLPFNAGFEKLNGTEKWLFLVTFLCSLISLVFFTAPAAMHRLMRPVENRERFKDFATRLIIIGLVPASVALVLSSQIVTSAVMGEPLSWIVAGMVTAIIGVVWWIVPIARRGEI